MLFKRFVCKEVYFLGLFCGFPDLPCFVRWLLSLMDFLCFAKHKNRRRRVRKTPPYPQPRLQEDMFKNARFTRMVCYDDRTNKPCIALYCITFFYPHLYMFVFSSCVHFWKKHQNTNFCLVIQTTMEENQMQAINVNVFLPFSWKLSGWRASKLKGTMVLHEQNEGTADWSLAESTISDI